MNQNIKNKAIEILGKIAEIDLSHELGTIDDNTFIKRVKEALRK